jgi:amidophosphoribosyltransferase
MLYHSYSNVYGIDMPSRSELVAHDRDTQSIAAAIGADLVVFQTLPDLVSSVRQFNPKITTFDCSVFTGDYITGGVDEAYLAHIEGLRADNVKGKVVVGDHGALNGKGGSSIRVNGTGHDGEVEVGANSGPVNGADDTVGLHNTWKTS